MKITNLTAKDVANIIQANPALIALQDEIERVNMALEDQIEAARLAVDMRDRTEFRCAELEAKLQQEQAWRMKQTDVTWKLNKAEGEIIKLAQDLKTEINNRDHFRGLVAQQDSCINIAKQKVKEFVEAADREKKNAEHLARKTLQLKDENVKLMAENAQFKEQTTRLIDDNRKLHEKMLDLECEGCITGEMGKYCGGCLSCQLRQREHSMADVDKALRDANIVKDTYMPVADFYQTTVEKLKDALRLLRDRWPGTWPTKKEIIRRAFEFAKEHEAQVQTRFNEMRAKLAEKDTLRVNIKK